MVQLMAKPHDIFLFHQISYENNIMSNNDKNKELEMIKGLVNKFHVQLISVTLLITK